jgi:SNF2 family DNA or RNA helicase
MQLYASELAKVTWSLIVWDEGHHLKTDTTKGYRAAFSLSKAQCRLILTGTPIQNKLEELWCLLNLVTHGRFNVSEKIHFYSFFVRIKHLSSLTS